ncbi:MAG: DUF4080 domain-containing protein [Candidatus Izemoplasmatales bacterium]|nr:DUF4080 domain-containing protein [Candidatus Izemoplasmatales bacterium]
MEKDVRMFPDDQVFDMIDAYRAKGAKTFKFLDRTFNLTTKRMLQMMKALILRCDEHTTYQFEVTGDILTKEAIQEINAIAPKGLFRFEIGIQSIHEETNLAVNRRQNNARLFENIHDLIAGGIVTLHLDLIAGLPYETRTMFQETFDTVFQFHAEELQLGFLKLLHGTLLRSSAISMGYAFSKEPPYEFTSNPWLCEEDLEIIREVEEMLDLLWNKSLMKEILLDLTKDASPFQTLYQLKQHFNQQHFSFHRFQLVELFAIMDDYLINTLHRPDLSRKLKKIYLMRHTQKPKIWWEKHRNNDFAFFRELHSKYPNIPIDDFYKYGVACRNEDFSFAVLFFPTGPFFIELP